MKKYDEEDKEYEAQFQKLQDAIQKPINDKSHTGWTTNGHTGEDVNTYGFGQVVIDLKVILIIQTMLTTYLISLNMT